MSIERVKALQEEIQVAHKEIERIQKECLHKRIRHNSKPSHPGSTYGSGSSVCADCDKMITCWSGEMGVVVEDKEWVEVKQ